MLDGFFSKFILIQLIHLLQIWELEPKILQKIQIISSKKLIRCSMTVSDCRVSNNLSMLPCYKILKYPLKNSVLVKVISKDLLGKKKETQIFQDYLLLQFLVTKKQGKVPILIFIMRSRSLKMIPPKLLRPKILTKK